MKTKYYLGLHWHTRVFEKERNVATLNPVARFIHQFIPKKPGIDFAPLGCSELGSNWQYTFTSGGYYDYAN